MESSPGYRTLGRYRCLYLICLLTTCWDQAYLFSGSKFLSFSMYKAHQIGMPEMWTWCRSRFSTCFRVPRPRWPYFPFPIPLWALLGSPVVGEAGHLCCYCSFKQHLGICRHWSPCSEQCELFFHEWPVWPCSQPFPDSQTHWAWIIQASPRRPWNRNANACLLGFIFFQAGIMKMREPRTREEEDLLFLPT